MAEKEALNLALPVAPPLPPPEHSQAVLRSGLNGTDWRKYASAKVSTEYDSEVATFLNKVSVGVLGGLAKLKASFHREPTGDFRNPMLGLATKYLNIVYDHEERNAFVTASANLGSPFQVQYLRDVKAQQGEAKLLVTAPDQRYKAEISYDLPRSGGLPRASVIFPNGEIKLDDYESGEGRVYTVNGLLGGKALKGVVTAEYKEECLNLKYKFKDDEVTVIPSILFPSNSLSIAFKRQFNPSNKLSYLYRFDTAMWSAVYKHKANEQFKIKAGYDSDACLAWASAWVGKEESGAKKAPRKCKLQVMVQVPQQDVRKSLILFKVKKRWDL